MKIKLFKKRITITKSDLRIMIVAIVLNLAFAAEKFFIVIGHQQSDLIWLFVYGGLGLILSILACIDFIHDEIEEEKHETNMMI